MKINSFKATNVHGYLQFDLTFFSELTFLIGINGSGKTSALKIILGLTSPSYYYLNQIKFEYCEVVCSTHSEERDIVIKAQVSDKSFVFSLLIDGVQSDSNSIPITNRNDGDELLYDNEEMIAIENRNKELFDNLDIVKKIRDLATPKFLGLDRRIYEGRLIDNRFSYGVKRHQYFHSKLRRRSLDQGQDSPAIDLGLDDIQLLVFEYFRKMAQQQPQISEQFKKRIFKQSFDFIDEFNNEPIPHSVDEVFDRKEKVLLAIQNLGLSYLNYDVNKYFQKIENIVKQNLNFIEQRSENPEKDTMTEEHFKILTQWFNNGGQLKRIDEIINYSQEYQAKILELREPLRRLESIATNFLKEGKKELVIESDGEIHVKLKNGKLANVYELSSGEKQIIIMIAHLIFEEDQKSSGIFIIDEPELSLHIAWQEIFVSSIMEASPKTQFILATHAPSIISKVDREKLCQDLNKLNY